MIEHLVGLNSQPTKTALEQRPYGVQRPMVAVKAPAVSTSLPPLGSRSAFETWPLALPSTPLSRSHTESATQGAQTALPAGSPLTSAGAALSSKLNQNHQQTERLSTGRAPCLLLRRPLCHLLLAQLSTQHVLGVSQSSYITLSAAQGVHQVSASHAGLDGACVQVGEANEQAHFPSVLNVQLSWRSCRRAPH